ncbi:HAMP domain-containing protein [Halovenus rubra]|uniref:HAMP domain-containing protein n=2 Tax=Halovenus rubra TaxID=869890 RepID=A0ACC7E0M5_9EURY|nr:HAMP domain-containing protein [Halovenus rubra]
MLDIRGKITGLLFILLVVAAVNVGAVYYVQQGIQETTTTIEVTNNQSVLSQEIAFHAFRKAEGTSDGTDLSVAIEQYERNLAALENGTDDNEAVANGLQTEPVPTAARPELRTQKQVWANYSQSASTIADQEPFKQAYQSAVDSIVAGENTLETETRQIVEGYRELNGTYTTELAVARELQFHRQAIETAVLQHSQAVATTVRFENRMASHIEDYERLFSLLEDGGTYDGQTVEPAPRAVQDSITKIRERWPAYRDTVNTVSELDRLNEAFWTALRYIETHSEELNNASATLAATMNDVIADQQQTLQRLLAGLFVLDVVVVLFCTAWVRRRVTTPLELVTRRAEDIANQDIDVTLPETDRDDEIGRLFGSFEQMRANIQSNMRDLQTAHEDADTARQMAEEARDEAQQARENAERLNEQLRVLDRLLRHNLKNDMNVVKLEARLIQKNSYADEMAHVETILKKTDELLEKTDKQRQITRTLTTDPNYMKFDLVRDIHSLVDEHRSRFSDATITFDSPESVTVIATGTLNSAFRELIENALMHNDSVTPVAEITITCTDTTASVRIEDNGPPLPEQEQDVLEGIQETDPLNHASGMGLWLVFWSLQQSNGAVAYERREPRGNVITVTIPRTETHIQSEHEDYDKD